MNKQCAIAFSVAFCGLIAFPAMAEPVDLLKKALVDDATPYLDLRYRFEQVDQDGSANQAKASTLRTKLGYKTGQWHHLSAALEFENITYLGNDTFNNTLNGKTRYPVIADPDSTEINHAFFTYAGIPHTTFNFGQQPLNLDNQRFIGIVGWRQNEQSYDAATITHTSLPDTALFYGYIDNVNRIFSGDHPLGDLDSQSHIFNAAYSGLPYGALTGYAYLLDFQNPAAWGLSSQTLGLRFNGNREMENGIKWHYAAEYARQRDYGNNPTEYDTNYTHFTGGVGIKGFTVSLGYEVLGSDGGMAAFQTPLATLHAFNGWADKFLSTPAAGLEDVYASVFYKVNTDNRLLDGITLGMVYHDFSAETGGADYGREWDASISKSFGENYSVLLKYADYEAEQFATDTEKLWLQLGLKF